MAGYCAGGDATYSIHIYKFSKGATVAAWAGSVVYQRGPHLPLCLSLLSALYSCLSSHSVSSPAAFQHFFFLFCLNQPISVACN